MTEVVLPTPAEHYQNALQKLRWALGGSWSVSLLPVEAEVVLARLEALEKPRGTVDHRPKPDEFYLEEDDAQQ